MNIQQEIENINLKLSTMRTLEEIDSAIQLCNELEEIAEGQYSKVLQELYQERKEFIFWQDELIGLKIFKQALQGVKAC